MNREELIQRTAIALFVEAAAKMLRDGDCRGMDAEQVLDYEESMAECAWASATILADAQPKEIGGDEPTHRPDDHMGNEIQEQRIACIEERLGKIQVSLEALLAEYGLGNDG